MAFSTVFGIAYMTGLNIIIVRLSVELHQDNVIAVLLFYKMMLFNSKPKNNRN